MTKQGELFDNPKWIDFPIRKNKDTRNPVLSMGNGLEAKAKSGPNYAEFYSESTKYDTNVFNQAEEKLSLLKQYFPGQFGEDGREPLEGKNDAYIGTKFNYLVKSAKEYSKN